MKEEHPAEAQFCIRNAPPHCGSWLPEVTDAHLSEPAPPGRKRPRSPSKTKAYAKRGTNEYESAINTVNKQENHQNTKNNEKTNKD